MSEQISMDDIFAVMDANAAKNPPKKKRKYTRRAKKPAPTPKRIVAAPSDVQMPTGDGFELVRIDKFFDEIAGFEGFAACFSFEDFGIFRIEIAAVNFQYLDKEGKWKHGGRLSRYHGINGDYGKNFGMKAMNNALCKKVVKARREDEATLPQDD